MDALDPGLIRFRIHAPNEPGRAEEDVDAAVFAAKLGALIKALKAADKAANGAVVHDYRIRKLQSSSPTALIAEVPIRGFDVGVVTSGIDAFDECATAISLGQPDRAREFGGCARSISDLTKGAERRFGYAEVWTGNDHIIRIDPFLMEQARAVVAPPKVPKSDQSRVWYKGNVHASFEGAIQVVDVRGALPEIKLVLSAGGKQIDCVCNREDIEALGAALNKRVRVSGLAIYDGKSGLPRRVQVSDMQVIESAGDITRWRGAFEPFAALPWEGDLNE